MTSSPFHAEHVSRSGVWYRVCDPSWSNPSDISYSMRFGGRWNAPGSFGVLHLNHDLAVAAANALRVFDGEAFGLFDLNPVMRPHVQLFKLSKSLLVDVVSAAGISALGLPASYPWRVGHERCRPIGAAARAAGEFGLVCRSAVGATKTTWVGEEAVLFERGLGRVAMGDRLAFTQWFGDAARQR